MSRAPDAVLTIVTPTAADAPTLAALAASTFFESHGTSGPRPDLEAYVASRLGAEPLACELADPGAIHRLAYVDGIPAGFSKIVPDATHPSVAGEDLCKMDRLYVASAYHDRGIGRALFDLNVQLARERGQRGMWLYVWQGNARAIAFYRRQGFATVAETTFQISARHANPNFIMRRAL